MKQSLDIRYFAHSWVSDWHHGNAHFLRGLAKSLFVMGHRVRCYEQLGAWSLTSLMRHEGDTAIQAIDLFRQRFADLDIHFYNDDANFAEFAAEELRGADVVIIHDWTEPHIANAILALKEQLGFRVLFHDTHHRAYTDAGSILRFHLHLFDGVLAFGEAIRRIYQEGFGVPRVWTFHEAADIDNFVPMNLEKTNDVVWIGNWGDDERTPELQEFLIGPAGTLRERKIAAYGVRYSAEGIEQMKAAGIDYRGYLPNLQGPAVYSQSAVTVHVPRRQYSNGLSGIPTIRVFESLACGVPLVCSPWADVEGLFRAGQDYIVATDGRDMVAQIEHLLHDDAARRQLAESGLETIRQRHTCAHRAAQLTEICEELSTTPA